MTDRYKISEKLLSRAEKSIPLGTQTFSKSKTQYPFGVSPYFIKKSEGSLVWDVDGNEYVDFVNALASVTLGYNDPDVTQAVRNQLQDGVIFTLPHPIEIEVAEKIIDIVPCAEMVRFGKNGSDATAGAIRLARAFTRRDRVAVCGYHGWQDWYIGSTLRNLGVPDAVSSLTHVFAYNDINSLNTLLQQHKDEFAAVIMEPMNVVYPIQGYLSQVKELAHRHGALLIFDETITGFRFSAGGAQSLFGVTPDLATFGKGLANGYPLSAIAGRKDIMRLMEEIFFSFTFGGETLSLAAALATLRKITTEPVIETIYTNGEIIKEKLTNLIIETDCSDFASVSGHPSWSFLNLSNVGNYSALQIKTYLLQELFSQGFLSLGTHNVSYAHTKDNINSLISAYQKIFLSLKDCINNQSLEKSLRCTPLVPLFRVR